MNKKIASLFAGIGGIDLGFQQAGFTVNWSNDFDKFACQTFNHNLGHKIIYKDLNKLEITDSMKEIDVLCGGFPCQPFSRVGPQDGFKNETKGTLFFTICKLLEIIKPPCIFLENVEGLLSNDEGRTMQIIQSRLKELGYYVKVQLCNTFKYSNIPQSRPRVYIVGFLNQEHYLKFEYPNKVFDSLNPLDLMDAEVPDKYYCYHIGGLKPHMHKFTEIDCFYRYEFKELVPAGKGLCPCIVASQAVYFMGKDKKPRRVMPQELLRFQGFPDWYRYPDDVSDSQRFKQAGNSVTVPVIKRLADNIYKAMYSEYSGGLL